MPYIIEKISLFENANLKETNIVVKKNVIYSRDTSVKKVNFIRLQLDKHIMIASESVLGSLEEWQTDGLIYAEKMLNLGSTTVIFPVDVAHEYQIKQNMESARTLLEHFPLDYVLILRMRVSLIKPSVVRYCRMNYIPAVIVVINDLIELQRVSWSWIREAVFPYKLVFLPCFNKRNHHQYTYWGELLKESEISHTPESLPIHEHLPKSTLKLLGLYPFKGVIRSGGEVSYNIIKEIDYKCLINSERTYYDKIEFTVFKNEVVRSGADITLPTGKGEELIIKVPGYFH